MAFNNLRSERLRIGQELRIPGRAGAKADADLKAADVPSRSASEPGAPGVSARKGQRFPSDQETYVVEKGDSLYRIARAFDTTPKTLMAVNGLSSTKLKIGQEIRIPVVQNTESVAAEPVPKEQPLPVESESVSADLSPTTASLPTEDEASAPRRIQVVKAGFEMLGVRYKYGGSSKKSGFDCSGLVKELFSRVDIELPRSSREQFRQGEKVDRDELEAGDLVFFSSGGKQPSHVGIYIGDNKFLHAARKARQVIISDLNKIWYNMRYIGARRITDLWKDDTDSGIPAE